MKIPLAVLALDGVGTILIGLGVAAAFVDVHLVPATLQFANYGLALIAVGLALTVPFIVTIVHRRQPRQGHETGEKS